jgi:cytochrome P450
MGNEIDLASWEPGYTSDPYPVYERLRRESPVQRAVVDGLPVWLITRHDDVRSALADPRLSNDPGHAGPAARAVDWVHAGNPSALARHMLRSDPPMHTRLRRLVVKAFTPRRVEGMRPRVQQIADDLLARFLPLGRGDLIADLAQPLPLAVLTELLGIPVDDRHDFVGWASIYAGTDEGDAGRIPEAMIHMRDYIVKLIDSKAAGRRGDAGASLLDALIAVRDEGERLSHAELLSMSFLLLLAGYETTANLIGNGMLALLCNPGQMAALRADSTLLKPAIEELLRFESPVKMAPAIRFARQQARIGEVVIPAGDAVLLALGAADRDPARFPEPDRLDIRRDSGGHLAFGHGVHYCLGAPLARVEAEVAFSALLAGCSDLALAGAPTWRHSRILRGLKHLPVTFTSAVTGPG